jgi:hypothetical protein
MTIAYCILSFAAGSAAMWWIRRKRKPSARPGLLRAIRVIQKELERQV